MPDPALARHIAACNNIPSPAGLIPFRVGTAQVGWVSPDLAQALTFRPRDFHFDGDGVALAARLRSPGQRSEALAQVLPALATGRFLRIRGELFDVRDTSAGPALATLDRGALPAFGVMSQGVHVNGIVRREAGLHVWVGIRARDKAVAPGLLDNIVAGGIPAGLSAEETPGQGSRRGSLPAPGTRGAGAPGGPHLLHHVQCRGPAARRAALLRPRHPRGRHPAPRR